MNDIEQWRKNILKARKKRTYMHLDKKLDLDDDRVFKYVRKKIENIKKHQFLPFIKKVEKKYRYRQNDLGVKIKKPKLRPLMYSSHIDSHIYSYFNSKLSKKYEDFLRKNLINENVIAYRKISIDPTDPNSKNKCNIHFAKEIFDAIENQGDCVVITSDITSFFDKVHHKILKDNLSKLLQVEKLHPNEFKIYKSLCEFKYIEQSDFQNESFKKKLPLNKYKIYKFLKKYIKYNSHNYGIPQGSPISGLFSNIYMVNFDLSIAEKFPNIFYRRYSDDLILICKEKEHEEIVDFIKSTVIESKLKISNEKTYISSFKKIKGIFQCTKVTDGKLKNMKRRYIDYLGFEYYGYKTQMRTSSLGRLKNKQIKKVKKRVFNNFRDYIYKKSSKPNIIGKYLKISGEVFSDDILEKQIIRISRKRNLERTRIANWQNKEKNKDSE